MRKYIDAERLIKDERRSVEDETFTEKVFEKSDEKVSMRAIVECFILDIESAPAADVEPVKHGSWIPQYENLFTPDEVAERTLVGYKCSECGREIDTREEDTAKVVSSFPYCHCGAKMDEGC